MDHSLGFEYRISITPAQLDRRIAEAVAAERRECAELARRMDHEGGYTIAAAICARAALTDSKKPADAR